MVQQELVVQFQQVASWIGIISGIVSIVLSAVAIAFAVLVNNRATDVNDQTIQALKKIESDVQHLSEDTRDLIKAGWNKMLGSVERQASDQESVPAKEIASGIAAELKAELTPLLSQGSAVSQPALQERIDHLIRSVEGSMAAQLRAQRAMTKPAEALDRLLNTIGGLSLEARAIVEAMRYHIELDEYQKLRKSPLGPALEELRTAGILIPVQHRAGGEDVACYYFPPGLNSLVRAAIPLLPALPKHISDTVRQEMKLAGYDPNPSESLRHRLD